MTSNWKKDQQDIWKTPKPSMIPNHDDGDDQDIYISERSSIASSDDFSMIRYPIGQRVPTPSPALVFAQKPPPVLRYPRHESPECGPLPTTQIQFERKEEKITKKPRRKPTVPPGGPMSVSETRPSEFATHHPVFHRVKAPDRTVRHRPSPDGQATPHDPFNTPQQAAQASLTTSPIKPSPAPRPARREGVPTTQSHHLIHLDHDHAPPKASPRQPKETENDERRDHSNRRAMPPQQHRYKPKSNHDWADQHLQSLSTKSPQEPHTLFVTSNAITSRSNPRPKNPLRHETDENSSKHRHYPNHSPSIPSQPNHHHFSHIRRRPPSGVHMTSELPLVDVSSKKFERSSQFQNTRDLFRVSPSPPAPLYNPSSHLPPIVRDNHSKANVARFPNEYYGTLARQSHVKDWEESMEIPKVYKSDPPARFYDRYLTIMPDKRLVA